MKWSVIGDLASGMPGKLAWSDDDGDGLTGSPGALAAVDALTDDVPVTPLGPYVKPDPSDETTAYVIAYTLLAGHPEITGATPDLSGLLGEIPADAVS